MIEPEKLKSFLDQLVKDPSLKMLADGTTFCNVGLHRCADLFGYAGFNKTVNDRIEPMMAREIIGFIRAHPQEEWLVVSGKQAADYALRGGFAISFMSIEGQHDHVAAIYPSPMGLSGSLNRDVPFVANIGKKNGVMKSSQAFPVANGEASYAILV